MFALSIRLHLNINLLPFKTYSWVGPTECTELGSLGIGPGSVLVKSCSGDSDTEQGDDLRVQDCVKLDGL